MQETTQSTQSNQEIEPERKLTREQRRIQQRISEEAQFTYSKLAKSYFDFFMDNDPQSEEVKAKEKEVVSKWRMYCKQRQLIPAVFDQLLDYCQQVNKDYQTTDVQPE